MKDKPIVIPSAMRIVSAVAIATFEAKVPRTLPHWGRSDLPRPGCICFACNLASFEQHQARKEGITS